jgi:hypothetical protein
MTPTKTNARGEAGVLVEGWQANTTNQSRQQQSSIDSVVLKSKSTATEIQLDKAVLLLRQGPKTTIDLRNHGIMMPAARVFQLKNERGHTITSEMVTLYDENGFRHVKCARYHLIHEAPQQHELPGVSHE